jgi:hypothetical protein
MIAHVEPFRHAWTLPRGSMTLEILHGTLVLLGLGARLEGTEIAARPVFGFTLRE